MDVIENKPEEGTNGVIDVPSEKVIAKPWTLAGFKTRDEWRKSKGMKTGKKAKVKAAAKSKPKKVKKAAKKVKAAGKSKPVKKTKAKGKKIVKAAAKTKGKKVDRRKKPSAPKKGSVKDGALKLVPLAKCSPNVKKVLLAMPKGKVVKLGDIIKKAFPSLPHAKASSRTRNQLRFIRTHGMAKLVGEGRYRRVA